MKNKVRILAIATFALVLATAAFAKPTTWSAINIVSQSSHNLGNVEITLQGIQPVYQYVPYAGTFTVNGNAAPTSVIINSYVIPFGSIGWAITADGARVKVDFSGGNNIVIQDQQIVQ
jgi:hypothetical protein